MRRPIERVIDPRNIGRIVRSKRLGGITERDLLEGQRRLGRSGHDHPFILTASIGPWYRENVPAAGGIVTMRLLFLATSSTNPATDNTMYNSGTGVDITVANAGRVVGAMIVSGSAVTAGNAIAAVLINSSASHTITDCEINLTHTTTRMSWLGWRRGIPFAAGDTIEAIIYTPNTFTPTTADMQVTLFVAWDEPE